MAQITDCHLANIDLLGLNVLSCQRILYSNLLSNSYLSQSQGLIFASCFIVVLFGSADSKSREESAKLLGCLIKACDRLMSPYVVPVLQVSSNEF